MGSKQIWFDIIPMELIALCIPGEDPVNFLSLFKNPKQLFKIWFKVNYPEYFNILEYDRCEKITNRKGIFTQLFTLFKKDFKTSSNKPSFVRNNNTNKVLYPIFLLRDYPNLYKEIIKYKDKFNHKKDTFYTTYSHINLLEYSYTNIFTLQLDEEIKLILVKSAKIKPNPDCMPLEYIYEYENSPLYKYLVNS